MKTTIQGLILTLSFTFLLIISCSKDQGPAVTPVSFFTTQIPTGPTLSDRWKTDSPSIELGLKFRSAVAVNILGIKFYKTTGNLGTHIAQLYSSNGDLLASDTIINETDSGWQSVLFPTSIPIAANTTFIAAYFSSEGDYISTNYALKKSMTNGTLSILADGQDGPNGVYKYTSVPIFPDSTFLSTNYWIDVIEEKQ